ncbi:MAG: hypothetical protein ACE5NG_12645 [bacterium]
MSLLTRQDWEMLRNKYQVAFSRMHPDLFKLFLDKIYGPKSNPGGGSANPGKLDDIDAMMIYLARAEPPIRPAAKAKTEGDPPIGP